jgi:hypothetical protein
VRFVLAANGARQAHPEPALEAQAEDDDGCASLVKANPVSHQSGHEEQCGNDMVIHVFLDSNENGLKPNVR